MDEGTSKAIPLRRSRGGTRALRTGSRRWLDGIGVGVRRLIDPPRQVWLASLGGAALTLRGARELWAQMVAEGAAVESRLQGALGVRSRADGAR
jgi:hypothetical protein